MDQENHKENNTNGHEKPTDDRSPDEAGSSSAPSSSQATAAPRRDQFGLRVVVRRVPIIFVRDEDRNRVPRWVETLPEDSGADADCDDDDNDDDEGEDDEDDDF